MAAIIDLDRCHPSKSIMAAIVRLKQPWEALSRDLSFFYHVLFTPSTSKDFDHSICRGRLSLLLGVFPVRSAPCIRDQNEMVIS